MAGIIGIIFSLVLSVNLWVLSKSSLSDISFNWWLSAGQILAILGAVGMGMTFILSARWKVLEDWFGGLDKVYKIHQIMGALSTIALINHPVMLTIQRLPNYEAASLLLLPSRNFDYTFGILALWILIGLLIITMLIKLPYQVWLTTHQFMGAALLLACLHVFLISSDVSNYWPLKYWVLGWMVIGAVSFIYHKWMERLFGGVFDYAVTEINKDGDMLEIWMKPVAAKIRFNPGQFAFFEFMQKELEGESHPFSMASAPGNKKGLKIVAKILGDYTLKLKELKPETKVIIKGPYGRFSQKFKEKTDSLVIAGGIGVTPFLSMIEDENNNPTNRRIFMYYCAKSKQEAYGIKELKEKSQSNNNINIKEWYSDEKPRLTVEAIKNEIKNLEKMRVYLCGPTAMMEDLEKQLVKSGVRSSQIYYENFGFK